MALDSLGREVGHVQAKDLLEPVTNTKSMSGTGEPASPFQKKLLDNLKDLKDSFKKSLDQLSKDLNDAVKQMASPTGGGSRGGLKSAMGGMSDKGLRGLFDKQNKAHEKANVPLEKLAHAGLHKGSIETRDWTNYRSHMQMIKQNSTMLQVMVQMSKGIARIAGIDEKSLKINTLKHNPHTENFTATEMGIDEALEDLKEDAKETFGTRQTGLRRRLFGKEDFQVQMREVMEGAFLDPLTAISHQTGKVATFMMGEQMGKGIFGGHAGMIGTLAEVNQLQKEMNLLAFTTEGITLENQKQQKLFRANNELSDISVSSGQQALDVRKGYLKLLQKGYRSEKETLKVTRTSANLSTMLGSEFEQTAEFMNEMHINMGLTADQVDIVSRGMQNTARSSKLSGAALLQAANATKPMMMNMRKMGSLTAEASKNLITMQATAQKEGFGEAFTEMFQAMSGPIEKAAPEMQNFLFSMAGMGKARQSLIANDLLNDKGSMKQMAGNLQSRFRMMTGRNIGDIENMDPRQRADINRMTQGSMGMGLGELEAAYKIWTEGGKSFSDKLTEINEKMKDAATTEEERLKLTQQQTDLIQNQRTDIATSSIKILSNAKSMEQGLTQLGNNRNFMRGAEEARAGGLFGNMSAAEMGTPEGLKKVLKSNLKESLLASNKILGDNEDTIDDKFIVKDVDANIARAENDPKLFANLQKRSQEAAQAAAASGKLDADPAAKAAKTLNSINSQFTKFGESALMYLKIIAGAGMIGNTGIVSVVSGVLSPLFRGGGKGGLMEALLKTSGDAIAKKGGLKTIIENGLEKANKASGGSIGAGIFGGAQLQERIPLYGRFAKMFGGGSDVAGQVAKKTASRNAMSAMTGVTYVPDALSGAELGAQAGGKSLARVGAKAAIPLMIFMTAMEATSQALKSGTKASELFSEHVGELANHQIAAAQGAGLLTGILNTLTFGIFDHWIGATGTVTKWLAHLIDAITPLNMALQAIMIPLKALYGIFWGLVGLVAEVGKGIWYGLMTALEPINEAFNYLWVTLQEVWGILVDAFAPLTQIFGEMNKGATIAGTLISALKGVGWAFGGLFQLLGYAVKGILTLAVPFIKMFAIAIKSVAETIAMFLKPIVQGVSRIVGGIVDIFSGNILQGLSGILGGLVQAILSALLALPAFFVAAMINMWANLSDKIGNFGKDATGVGKLIYKYLLWPFRLLATVFRGVGSAIAGLIKMIELISHGDFSGARKMFIEGIQDVMSWFVRSVPSMFSSVWTYFRDAFMDIPGYLFRGIKAKAIEAAPAVVGGGLRALPGVGGIFGLLDALGIKIPGLAVGGVVTNPTLAMIGESGPEAIVPLDMFAGANVNPMAANDVESQVQRDRIGRNGNRTSTSQDLSIIAELSQKQVEIMAMQLNELRDIKAALTSTGGGIDRPSTRARVKPKNATNYYTLSFGNYSGNASKNILNDGL